MIKPVVYNRYLSRAIIVIEYLIVLMIILRNDSMLTKDHLFKLSRQFCDIIVILSCFACIAIRFYASNKNMRITKTNLQLIGISMLIAFLCCVIPRVNVFGAFGHMFFVLFGFLFLFATSTEPKDILIKFVNVVAVMAVISLVLYFAGTVFKIIPPTRIAEFDYDKYVKSCNCYLGLQYEAQVVQGTSWVSHRNTGFFIEAPMYNFVLCYALACELAFNKKLRIGVIAVLIITIITTQTTTGKLVLLVFACVYAAKCMSKKLSRKQMCYFIAVVSFVALSALVVILIRKMGSRSGAGSVSVRFDHMAGLFKIWMEYPLFGAGYHHNDVFYKYVEHVQGVAVGLPYLLAMNGIFMFLLYLIPWAKNSWKAFLNNIDHLYYYLGTIIILFLTAVIINPVIWFTIAFQLTGQSDRQIDREISYGKDDAKEIFNRAKFYIQRNLKRN